MLIVLQCLTIYAVFLYHFYCNKVSFDNQNFDKTLKRLLLKSYNKMYEGIPEGKHVRLHVRVTQPLIIRCFSHILKALVNALHFMSTFSDKIHRIC